MDTEQLARDADLRDIRFETRYEPGRDGEMRPYDVASWMVLVPEGTGIEQRTSERISRMMPRAARPATEGRPNGYSAHPGTVEWHAIKEKYHAWKAGQEAPINGTPLEAWNGFSSEDVRLLRTAHQIETVEQFANLSGGELRRCAIPNVEERVSRAQRWLTANSNTAEIQAALDERDAKFAAVTSHNEQLMARVEQLTLQAAQGGADPTDMVDTDDEPLPKRRGRPPKVQSEAA